MNNDGTGLEPDPLDISIYHEPNAIDLAMAVALPLLIPPGATLSYLARQDFQWMAIPWYLWLVFLLTCWVVNIGIALLLTMPLLARRCFILLVSFLAFLLGVIAIPEYF